MRSSGNNLDDSSLVKVLERKLAQSQSQCLPSFLRCCSTAQIGRGRLEAAPLGPRTRAQYQAFKAGFWQGSHNISIEGTGSSVVASLLPTQGTVARSGEEIFVTKLRA